MCQTKSAMRASGLLQRDHRGEQHPLVKRSRPAATSPGQENIQELSRKFCESAESMLKNMDVKDECKRQIIVYNAASKLVTLNIRDTRRSDRCGLCVRKFLADVEKRQCLSHLAARLSAFRDQEKNLNTIVAKRYKASVAVDLRATINFPVVRKGYASYIKQVKTTCLTKKKCPACKRTFEPCELGRFLSRLDRWSRDLHTRSLQEEGDEKVDKENVCPNRSASRDAGAK